MEISGKRLIDKQSQANQPINAMDYTELIIRELWPTVEPEKLQRYYGLGCENKPSESSEVLVSIDKSQLREY